MIADFRKHLDGRLYAMRAARAPWMQHWRECADFILPNRYKWLIQANQPYRGSNRNNNIVDSTATIAARTLARGFNSGVSSPTRPWFKLKIPGYEKDNEVSNWLAECQRRMLEVFQESDFYPAMAMQYFDLVVFGSSCILIYEDYENVIHCCNPCLGEFFFEPDYKGRIRKLAREFTMTYSQLRERFPDKINDEINRAKPGGDATLGSKERVIGHLLEKNEGFSVVPKVFPWRETYWDLNGPNDEILEVKGFYDWPAMTPRWDTQGNEPYGTCPGMDALGDTKQLQHETRRKGQSIDKMERPPMQADSVLKNMPLSHLPGGITYVPGMSAGRELMKPMYHIIPPINEMRMDIQEIQQRIKLIFHNDLFSGITDLQTVRTATEIDARREEKLVLLGPVLEHITNEGLGVAIDRVWGIMLRGGLLPPAPRHIAEQTQHIQINYISMLTLAMRGLSTASIEKTWAFAGNIAAIKPTILDGLDEDATLEEYADAVGAPSIILRGEDGIKAIRDAREAEEAQAKMAQIAPIAADGAKTLSETDVGGGINALQMALGNTPGG